MELKKSQDFFSSYIKKAPIGIFVINDLGQYVDVNEMACQMMGRTRAEVLKISPADYLMHEELEKRLEGFRVLLEKNRLNLKLHVKKR
ncbi:MAG: PAS domain-containing protein [Gammaproteobacteria bacterium]